MLHVLRKREMRKIFIKSRKQEEEEKEEELEGRNGSRTSRGGGRKER